METTTSRERLLHSRNCHLCVANGLAAVVPAKKIARAVVATGATLHDVYLHRLACWLTSSVNIWLHDC